MPLTPEQVWRRWDADEARLSAPLSERMLDLAELRPGMRVLDLATGRGEPAIRAARRVGPDGAVLGIDLDADMLAMAAERARAEGVTNLEMRVADVTTLAGVPDGAFDVALSRWALMYLDDPGTALVATRRALRPGGVLVAAVWAEPERATWYTLPRRLLDRPPSAGHLPGGHPPGGNPAAPGPFALADPGDLTRLLTAAGFVPAHLEDVAVEVMEAATDAELLDWVRAFGLARRLDGLPASTVAAWERDLLAATAPLRRDGVVRLGGVTRVVVARSPG